jgi:integrase
LHLTDDVVAALKDMTGGVSYLSGYVFPRTGAPDHTYDIRKAIVRLKKRSGLDAARGTPGYFRLHDLRHCTATVLLGQGHSLEKVGQYLGHKSLQSTKRYAHLEKTKRSEMGDSAFGGMGAADAD